ncbi:MAG: hypothetical protein O7G85_00770, partial [Planctomycetota bacterium]|nr:hypothetical protein [Planctomycetota bacterium]
MKINLENLPAIMILAFIAVAIEPQAAAQEAPPVPPEALESTETPESSEPDATPQEENGEVQTQDSDFDTANETMDEENAPLVPPDPLPED